MLELRYRGLRSPHKIKLGVSGCARECAEARGKDVGVIATDKGWNVYVGGNGGFTPRHAQLLAEDLDTETLVRTIDRFLMYYVRTADRLQRTAPWIEDVEGGLDGVRAVVMDDSPRHLRRPRRRDGRARRRVRGRVAGDPRGPEKLAPVRVVRQRPETPDPSLAYVPERGQSRPATGRRAAPPAARRRTRPRCRHHPGGPLMTALDVVAPSCRAPPAGPSCAASPTSRRSAAPRRCSPTATRSRCSGSSTTASSRCSSTTRSATRT